MKTLPVRIGYLVTTIILLMGGILVPGATNAPSKQGYAPVSGQLAYAQRPAPETKSGHPKLESILSDYEATYRTQGTERMSRLAEQRRTELKDGKIRVIAETQPGSTDEAAAAIKALGLTEEARYRNYIQLSAPASIFPKLADSPGVTYVRLPYLVKSGTEVSANPLNPGGGEIGLGESSWAPTVASDPGELTPGTQQAPNVEGVNPILVSEGVKVIGADAWQNAGILGQGIKVAVIDLGFDGYLELLGIELPSTVVAKSFRADGDISGFFDPHGTACAEIVHDVAPEAQLFLFNFETDVEWGLAVDAAIAQGVDVISSSVGVVRGPFNGTGPFAGKVTKVRNAGVLWAQSAGNYATDHWQGTYLDHGDGFADFAPGAKFNSFTVPPDTPIDIALNWDDWPASSQDYDLYLYFQQGTDWVQVDSSTNTQDGTQPPFESISGISPSGGKFAIGIFKFAATQNVKFELYASQVATPGLQFQVAASSLGIPGDSPGAVTTGATKLTNDELEFFSSQGPTADGRIKPDLVAPDRVSTFTFGPQDFAGTSASAPYVAGAAALVKSVNPTWSPAQVQGFLEQNAVHLGSPGKNNQYGSGRLYLGTPGTGGPGLPPTPATAADAKIEIVFPHDAAGTPAGITSGTLVNIGAFLFAPNTLIPVPCGFSQPVQLFRSLNNGVAEQVGPGVPGLITRDGKQLTQWEFKNVDVAAATNPLNKYYFFLAVEGLPSSTNVWSHGADARTIFPQQDVPTGLSPLGNIVDAKIEAVFPHDAQGNPKPVASADLANIAVDVFSPGTMLSVPPDAGLNVRLYRSLNSGMSEFVAVGQKQLATAGGVNFPQWVFNDVDVSAAKIELNKYYFRIVIDGLNTRSNVWSHGVDARTIFPTQDVPSASCQ